MKKDTVVDSNQAPYFGGDTEELHLLRKLHEACKQDAIDGVSEDILGILQDLKKVKRKKKN